MEPAFCERTRQLLIKTTTDLGLKFHATGTVVAIEGPRFSSKAESNMFRAWGGSVINMTSCPEVNIFYIKYLCLYNQLDECFPKCGTHSTKLYKIL